MFETLARPPVRISEEERIKKFETWVKVFGYRAPTRADLVPGAEMLMVDVAHYMELHNQGVSFAAICSTRIKLDDEPVVPSKIDPNKEVVYYHCMTAWDGQCFVPLEDFTTLGYRSGSWSNDFRWVMKA